MSEKWWQDTLSTFYLDTSNSNIKIIRYFAVCSVFVVCALRKFLHCCVCSNVRWLSMQ